jgi:hypothetical protein
MSEHTPQLSVWPLLVGFAMTLMAAGVLSSIFVTLVGVLLLLYALWSWVQENRQTGEAHQPVEIDPEERKHE